MHDAEGKRLSTFTAQAGETLTFDLVGDELVTPDGTHRIHKTHRWVCPCGVVCGVSMAVKWWWWSYIDNIPHSATNVGTTVFRELLVEKKKQTARTNVHFLATA